MEPEIRVDILDSLAQMRGFSMFSLLLASIDCIGSLKRCLCAEIDYRTPEGGKKLASNMDLSFVCKCIQMSFTAT